MIPRVPRMKEPVRGDKQRQQERSRTIVKNLEIFIKGAVIQVTFNSSCVSTQIKHIVRDGNGRLGVIFCYIGGIFASFYRELLSCNGRLGVIFCFIGGMLASFYRTFFIMLEIRVLPRHNGLSARFFLRSSHMYLHLYIAISLN